MNFTLMNLLSLLALAVAGAGLVVSGRRVLTVIREVEKKLSRAVDEKNVIAANLRRARADFDGMRNDIQQADTHITQLTVDLVTKENQLGRLRVQPRQVINMIDRNWQRFSRLFAVDVGNPTMGGTGMVPGAPTWDEGRKLYGFARSAEELQQRVLAHYPPEEGFIVGSGVEVDLTEYVAVDASALDADGQV